MGLGPGTKSHLCIEFYSLYSVVHGLCDFGHFLPLSEPQFFEL